MGVDFPAGFCYNAGKLSFYLSEALLLQYLTNLWNALDFGSLESILLRVASVFLCLTIHETCHGLAAYALGDPTAKRAHRLSLNPLRHIDWLGLIMMVAAGFGWAKPVPVDPSYFKKPKQGMALTALAGPVSNFLLALLLLLIARGEFLRAVTTGSFSGTWFSFLVDTASLSVGLGLFNLVPIPPLDGSKVLAVLLPDRAYNWLMRYERFGMLVLLVVISVGVGSNALNSAIRWTFTLLCRLVGFEVKIWTILFLNWKTWYRRGATSRWKTSRGRWI